MFADARSCRMQLEHGVTLTISRIFFYTCDSFHITKHLFIVNIFIIIIRAALIAAMSDLISNE